MIYFTFTWRKTLIIKLNPNKFTHNLDKREELFLQYHCSHSRVAKLCLCRQKGTALTNPVKELKIHSINGWIDPQTQFHIVQTIPALTSLTKTWGWGRSKAQRFEKERYMRKIILDDESLCFLQSMECEKGFLFQRNSAKQGMANSLFMAIWF